MRHGRHPAWFAWRRLRERIGGLGRGLWRFLGPIHASVQGPLRDAEWRRVGTKMVVMWITTATPTIGAMLKDPENLTLFFIPLVAAVVCGIFDAAFHMQTGTAAPPAPPTPTDPPS